MYQGGGHHSGREGHGAPPAAAAPMAKTNTEERCALPVTRFPYAVTALAPSASLADALKAHWRECLMEGAEIGGLMVSICFFGALLYSSESPLHSLALSRRIN